MIVDDSNTIIEMSTSMISLLKCDIKKIKRIKPKL